MGTKKVKNPMNVMMTSRSAGKSRVKGSITQDTIIEGNTRTFITTDVSGTAAGSIRLDLSTGATSAINAVGGLYQQYLFRPGTAFNYVPSVGLTTPGNIIIGWLDNPELMAQFVNGNISQRQAIVNTLANAKVYPLWQAFSMPLTAPPRLKKFDVNDTFETNAGVQLSTEFQRSCQGMWVYNIFSAPASTAVSVSFLHAKLQLWNLTNSYNT